jgi:hypothetical protein
MFSSDKSKQKKRRSFEANISHSSTEKPIHQADSRIRKGRSHSNLLNVPLHPLNQETKDPQKLAWVSPLDMLDYLGLGIDVLERTYIEMKMPPGEEKEFARFVNTLYFAIDAAMAILPGAGGGGLAVRASHNAGVAAWHALPASSKAHVIGEVTKQMGWSATRGSQAVNVFFSVKNGKGSGGNGKKVEVDLNDPEALRKDQIAHKGWYSRKKMRQVIHDAKYSNHGSKHIKARTVEEAKQMSLKTAQYSPGIDNAVLEKIALKKGTLVPRPNGAFWKIHRFEKPVGFDGGVETHWIRAEYSSGTYHGHPMSISRVRKYIKNAEN